MPENFKGIFRAWVTPKNVPLSFKAALSGTTQKTSSMFDIHSNNLLLKVTHKAHVLFVETKTWHRYMPHTPPTFEYSNHQYGIPNLTTIIDLKSNISKQRQRKEKESGRINMPKQERGFYHWPYLELLAHRILEKHSDFLSSLVHFL